MQIILWKSMCFLKYVVSEASSSHSKTFLFRQLIADWDDQLLQYMLNQMNIPGVDVSNVWPYSMTNQVVFILPVFFIFLLLFISYWFKMKYSALAFFILKYFRGYHCYHNYYCYYYYCYCFYIMRYSKAQCICLIPTNILSRLL